MIHTTPIYAAILAIIFVLLTIRVVLQRRAALVSLVDGGNRILLRRQRAHANFAEYVPLTLLLMLSAELQLGTSWLINLMGLGLLGGRIMHAVAVGREPEPLRLRVIGMALTLAAILIGAIVNLTLILN